MVMYYEKKKRLAKLRDSMKSYGYMDGVEELEDIFPELKEDERIKMDILEALRYGLACEESVLMPGATTTLKEAIAYLEKHKEQKPAINIEHLKSYMLQYLQDAANREDDSEIEADTDKWAKMIIKAFGGVEQKPAEWNLTDATFIEEIDETLFMAETGRNEAVKNQIERERNWLRSLHERFSLQPEEEWSEEDEKMRNNLIELLVRLSVNTRTDSTSINYCYPREIDWLKSLRPRLKEEREHLEIKYGGKGYQVYAVRSLPGGVTGYIIEDEPGHYDCIINPEEVLRGGYYGVKQSGSPYPTKDATFDSPHWKPSEEQMEVMEYYMHALKCTKNKEILFGLYNDLKKLM